MPEDFSPMAVGMSHLQVQLRGIYAQSNALNRERFVKFVVLHISAKCPHQLLPEWFNNKIFN
jgi:hypothetical protein